MAKKILFFFLVFLAFEAYSQLLKPLTTGISEGQANTDEVIATATDNHTMYVATRHFNGTGKGYAITINKWNGFYWQQLPAITFSDSSYYKNIAVFRGQVYIGGSFIVKSPIVGNSKTLVRFNPVLSKWEAVLNNGGGSGFSFLGGNGFISCMAVYKNQLFLGGYFYTIINNDTTQHLVAYNGHSFVRCGLGTANSTGTNGVVNALYVINDSLYVGGSFNKAGGIPAINLAIICDSLNNWKPAFFSSSGGGINKMASYQGNPVVLANDNKIFVRTNGIFQSITFGLNYNQITDIEEYNNDLWVSGSFSLSGVPSTLIKYNSGWSSGNLHTINISSLFKFKGGLYVISTNDMAGNLRINRIAQVAFAQGRIAGRVYQDVNQNCRFDPSLDKPFSNKVVKINGVESYFVKTDSEGAYLIYVNASSGNAYNVSLNTPKNWAKNTVCTKSDYTVTVLNNSVFDSLDFILKPLVTGADIKISLASNAGFTTSREYTDKYSVTYINNGTEDITSMAGIELIFDKKLSNFSATPPPSVINGNKAIWSIANLKAGEQRAISVSFKARTDSFNLNEKLNFIASSSFLADIDKSDNADTLVQEITQSAPTQVMKDVFPLPLANDSFSLVSAQSNEINYIIHFENTSPTDTIHSVIVIDTIDINAAIEYTQETGASHPYTTKLYNCPPSLGKGVLVWTFNNINLLPFESVDDVSNRGHIGFSIRFNNNLPLGTVIKNKAFVVFDYFDPLQTNNTYSKVSILSGIKKNQVTLKKEIVCSNPVSGTLVLLRNFEADSRYCLYNVAGSLAAEGSIELKSINTRHLAPGIYFLTITEKDQLISQKIIIQ